MATQSTQPRRRLSVAMIVRNEHTVLAETLSSVQPIADEILVLDTGSTDRTPSLAAEWGAVVCRAAWTDDFSAARNRVLDQVSGDWILWLDAGERLEAASALRQFVDHEADPQTAYLVMTEMPAADHRDSAEQAARLRLMPRTAQVRFEGRLCESVRRSAAAAGMHFAQAPGRIVCHPRRNDLHYKADKSRRDLRLIALERSQGRPLTPRLWITLGEAYSCLNQQVLAEQAFVQAIRAAAEGSIEMLEGYYGLLTTLSADLTQRDRRLLACAEALESFPLDAQLLCALGGYLQAQGSLELAERSFQTAVQYGQVNLETWHLVNISEVAASCLSLTLRLQHKDEQAAGVLEEALQHVPDSQRLRRQLIDLQIRLGRDEPAIGLAESMSDDREEREPMCDAVRGACHAARQHWGLALDHLQNSYAAGCRDPLCLHWLSVALLSTGQVDAAEPIVRHWHKLEPHNREAQVYLKAVEDWGKAPEACVNRLASQPGHATRFRFDSPPVRDETGRVPAPAVSPKSTLDTIADI